MASSGTYRDRRFNLAAQGHRQPGSAFKTMVLTAAIRSGINPNSTTYTSKPLNLNVPGYGPWQVKTFSNTYGGTMNLVRATLSSDNSVYAQLAIDVGPKKVCETAKLLGIETKLDCYPAEALGGLRLGVTPLEMANAYATLAAGGVRHKPTGIRKVEFPDGKSEDLGNSKGKRVLSDGQAYEVTKILKQNVSGGGTGGRAQFGCPAAGKTGTTDSSKDAWFVGYTPDLATSVWVGLPQRQHRHAQRAGRHAGRTGVRRLHAQRARRQVQRLPPAQAARQLLAVLQPLVADRHQRERRPLLQLRPDAHRPGRRGQRRRHRHPAGRRQQRVRPAAVRVPAAAGPAHAGPAATPAPAPAPDPGNGQGNGNGGGTATAWATAATATDRWPSAA